MPGPPEPLVNFIVAAVRCVWPTFLVEGVRRFVHLHWPHEEILHAALYDSAALAQLHHRAGAPSRQTLHAAFSEALSELSEYQNGAIPDDILPPLPCLPQPFVEPDSWAPRDPTSDTFDLLAFMQELDPNNAAYDPNVSEITPADWLFDSVPDNAPELDIFVLPGAPPVAYPYVPHAPGGAGLAVSNAELRGTRLRATDRVAIRAASRDTSRSFNARLNEAESEPAYGTRSHLIHHFYEMDMDAPGRWS